MSLFIALAWPVALEQATDDLEQQRAARRGTANFILALVQAGWSHREIGQTLGITQQAINARIRRLRREVGLHPSGLAVARRDGLPQASTTAEWLSGAEAAHFIGTTRASIESCRDRGLLPESQLDLLGSWRYAQADLDALPVGIGKVGDEQRQPG